MKTLQLALILCFCTALPALYAQETGSLRGYAQDKQSGERLKAATIVAKLGKREAARISVSDAGDFVLDGMPPGVYDLECQQDGYISQRIVGLEVKPDRIRLAYFNMSPGDPKRNPVEEIYTHAALEARLAIQTNTASRTNEAANNAPATLYVVTQEDIYDHGYNTLSEVLETLPGIEINRRASVDFGNIASVRGVWGNNKILILVDGIRFSPSSSDMLTIEENFDIRHAERIEVLLGPASAVYGADAVSAVVNIITKSGNKHQGIDLSAGYGMFHTTQNSFRMGLSKGDWSMTLGGGFYSTQGPQMQRHYPGSFDWYNNRNYLGTC